MTSRQVLGAEPRRRRRGQASVEFALTLVPFLMFVMAILEGGRMVATYFALENAAREGARAGRYLAISSDSVILSAVNTTAAPFTGTLTSVSGTPTSSCATNTVCVCRHTSTTAATSASCDATSSLVKGSVIDVKVNYTFGLVPFMRNNTFYCLLCQATINMTSAYRAVME